MVEVLKSGKITLEWIDGEFLGDDSFIASFHMRYEIRKDGSTTYVTVLNWQDCPEHMVQYMEHEVTQLSKQVGRGDF